MIGRFSLACLAVLLAASASAAPRGLTAEDLVRLERVGTPMLSPDGTRIAYPVRETDMERNGGRTAIWVVELGAPAAEPRRLTRSDGNESSPQWSANARVRTIALWPQ